MIPYFELDTNCLSVIKKDWKPPGNISEYYIKTVNSKKIDNFVDECLDPNFVDIVNQFYIFKYAALFNKPVDYCPECAHVDAEFTSFRFYALNINPFQVEDNGKMVWYDINTDVDPKLWTHKKSEVPAVSYPFDKLKINTEFPVNKKICLVRTDIPHAIFLGKKPRYCISFRFDKKDNESWDDVITNFKQIDFNYCKFLQQQQQISHQIPNTF